MPISTLRRTLPAIALSSAALLSASMAFADKSDDTLRVALQIEIANLDTYYDSAGSVSLLSRHIWDSLTYIDPVTSELVPLLAESYSFPDETTMELMLRKGVTFHDGSAFDADDVIYTLDWITNPENGAKTIADRDWIESFEKVDDHTVRIHMTAPNAMAARFLTSFPIYPTDIYAENRAGAMNITPIGTGPYMVASMETGSSYTLERSDSYFADGPKGTPAIKTLLVRIIPDPSTQIAEILSGGLDWIYKVPADQASEMSGYDGLVVSSVASSRLFYMVMDAAGRNGEDSPYQSRLVRQAISHAIDRQGMVDAFVGGGAAVQDAFCFSDDFGCPHDAVTYDYDPDKARALLAEAGYPDGFSTNLSGWRDRPYVEAIQNFLGEVGINAEINYVKLAPLKEEWFAGERPLIYGSIGSQVADVGNFVPEFFGLTDRDLARDGEVAGWLEEANMTTDVEARRELLHMALRKVAEEAYALPLFSDNMNYVASDDLEFVTDSGGNPHFYMAHWK